MKLMQEALAENPDDIELLIVKAYRLFKQRTSRSFTSAVSILTRITDTNPQTSQAWNMLARIRFDQARSREALELLDLGLVHAPNNKSLMLTKARIYAAESVDRAIEVLQTAQKSYPNDMEVALYLVYNYIDATQYDNALKLLKKTIDTAAEPDIRKIRIAFAVALYESGNLQQSQEIFHALYVQDPDDEAIMIAQIRILKKHKDYIRIVQIVTDWLTIHPKDTRLATKIAYDLAGTKDQNAKNSAATILNVIIQIDYDAIEAIHSLAILHHTTGKYTTAVQLYERVLMLDPGRLGALNNMAWILCENLQQYEQALELSMKGLQEDSEYVDLIDTAAVAKYRLGRYQEALGDFNRCMKIYPPSARGIVNVYFHIARTYLKLDGKIDAEIYIKKALHANEQTNALSQADLEEAKAMLTELSKG
jgi:tetratricopeptide (TPR) repeat protein